MILHRNVPANGRDLPATLSAIVTSIICDGLLNELLLKILAELPDTVKTILTLATTCHWTSLLSTFRLHSAQALHLFPDAWPFVRLQTVPVGHPCKFSNNFHQGMRQVKRSLLALKHIGSGKFSTSFEHMDWLKRAHKTACRFLRGSQQIRLQDHQHVQPRPVVARCT